MENASGNRLKIYWGLLISEAFLGLSVTLKATIILLHRLHSRSKNKLTVQACALTQFGIHRNRLPGYLRELVSAGLLLYIENHDYEFSWIDGDGKPDFDRIKKISMHLTHTDPAPNSYQEVINGYLTTLMPGACNHNNCGGIRAIPVSYPMPTALGITPNGSDQ
jgi:hypothetical protein